jgi:Bacteriophage holin family
MQNAASRRDTRLSAVFLSPFNRLEVAPAWGKAVAAIAAIYQYVRTDAFSGALLLLVFIGLIDYWLGVKAAKYENTYDATIAHRGVMGKICGIALVFLVRLIEGYIQIQGLGDTHGIAATAIALQLFVVDLQSIAHHREQFGGAPLAFLVPIFAWLDRFGSAKIPAPPKDDAAKPSSP